MNSTTKKHAGGRPRQKEDETKSYNTSIRLHPSIAKKIKDKFGSIQKFIDLLINKGWV